MTDLRAGEPPTSGSSASGRSDARRVSDGALAVAGLVVSAILAVVIWVATAPEAIPPATGAASMVPADSLAYVNVSLDRRRLSVRQATQVGARFPDFSLAGAAVQGRLGPILSGGRPVDFGASIQPWLGNEAALALLNTSTTTAGTLIVLDVRNRSRALTFIRARGAVPHGNYRGTTLYAYRTGNELALISHYLVVGQDTSVRSALDVAAGATPALAGSGVYQRATATEPDGRVLDAYASLAGVRRLLSPRGGVIGALGDLLYQPALQGVALSVSPAPTGARVLIHSALDPTLAKLSSAGRTAFTPTLGGVMPDGSIMLLDVRGLDRVAPSVLAAGSTAGVAGGIGPLLSRLGVALGAEGVNVHDITSIFSGETAVAIVPHAKSRTLVVVARTRDGAQTQAQLGQLEVPLAQLFKAPSGGPGRVPGFTDRTVAGVTDHQLALAKGLEFDYAVFRGLVVVSTSAQGVAAVARRTRTLAAAPAFRRALAGHPSRVTSLVYLALPELLALTESTGLTSSASYRRLRPDLGAISSIGLTSTHSSQSSSVELSARVP